MPITDFLIHNSQQYPNKVCLVEINPEQKETRKRSYKDYELIPATPSPYFRREITWQVFNEKANRFAHLLLSRGIKKGDKVGILMMNCIEWLPIYFGILKTGALAVPFNYRFTSNEIEYCLRLSEVDVLVFGSEFIGRLEEIYDSMGKRCPMIYVGNDPVPAFAEDYKDMVSDMPSTEPGIPLADEDYAAIYFSSGTTGFPKAILHRHKALMHSCRVEQNHHGQTPEDVFLCIPPLYHTGAKMHWFGSLMTGGRAVLLKGTKPEYILETASKEQCTILWLLVPWAQDLLFALDRGELNLKDYKLDQLRLMHIGAQPVPQSLVKRWLTYFPNQQYDTNYGLSESIGPGCVHLGVENTRKVGAIGVPGYGWQVKIVDEKDCPVKGQEVGELCVKGDGVMVCYYNDEKATKEVLKDGWLYTGDMAMQDEEGFIFLVDRKKDVIISGGENLYPVQIEDFLSSHPDVMDVAVIGLPDSRLGEIAAAIVEIKEGHHCTEQDLEEFCHQLPRYKRPKKFILAKVPRNATGKIEKPKLRKMFGASNLVDAQNKA